MTVKGAVAQAIAQFKDGPNEFPEIVDDIRGTGIVPINVVRMHLSTLGKIGKKMTTRVIDGKLMVYVIPETV